MYRYSDKDVEELIKEADKLTRTLPLDDDEANQVDKLASSLSELIQAYDILKEEYEEFKQEIENDYEPER